MLRKVTASLLALGVAAAVSAQGPCFDLALGTNLALTDDSNSAALPLGFSFTYNGVTYTDICVCSNGYIWLGPVAGAADFSPTEAELLAQAPRICPMWTDLNPGAAGSGQVYFDASVPGVAKITWAGVFRFGSTDQNSMQVVLDASSSVTVTYGPCTTAANPIVGASPGVGSISNPVSLATRPVVITQNNFAQVITAAAGTPFVYSNTKMLWSPTSPGYLISDVSCTPNSLPVPATSQSVGIGCPAPAGPSLYETFGAANAADLSGLNLTLLPSGTTDYIALPNLSPAWFSGFATNLVAGDDTTHLVTLPFSFPYNGGVETQIYVSSNGFFTLGATNPGSGCCTGNVTTMLAGSPRLSGWWEDLDASAGGAVYADLDALTGEFVVTWNAVPEYLAPANVNSFQIALSPSGSMTWRWQTVVGTGGPYLAGYSKGGNSADPGVANLSAVNGATISTTVVRPLTIAAATGSRPQLGGTFTVNASNIQSLPNGVFSILLISTEIPGGLPLDVLGLTGCTAYVQLPEVASFFNLTLGAATTSWSTPLPLDNSLFGLSLMSQAISDDLTANAFGYRVSNGLRWNFGL
jgi:hypothetical protein